MSRNGAPIASDHEEQMAFARQFQAERGPVKPRKHNRHRGESAKKAPESLNGNHKPTSYGNQVTSHLGRSTSITTSVNRGTSSAMRTGVRGGGLSSSIWADSTTQDYVPPHLRDREVSTAAHDSPACNDSMDKNQPEATAASPMSAQPATGLNALSPGSEAGCPVSKNSVAEKSILDEDVPFVKNWENIIQPIKVPTMLPRDGGLRTSRWAPRFTLDGREIED